MAHLILIPLSIKVFQYVHDCSVAWIRWKAKSKLRVLRNFFADNLINRWKTRLTFRTLPRDKRGSVRTTTYLANSAFLKDARSDFSFETTNINDKRRRYAVALLWQLIKSEATRIESSFPFFVDIVDELWFRKRRPTKCVAFELNAS